MSEAAAGANANVALVKYWGKRNEELNLPYTGSISVTLDGLLTTARVKTLDRPGADRIYFEGGAAAARESARVSRFLDLVRHRARRSDRLEVLVESNFPVAAGLASSASVFAALTLAAAGALELELGEEELSALARRGSGSAARSIHGGWAEWLPGEASDGADSYAVPLASADHWDLGVVVAVTDPGPKAVGSREGMAQAVKKSPFFPAWLESHDADLEAARAAIAARDLHLLGRTAEHNCLKMHAVCMASNPALIYWKPATLAVIERVRRLRDSGTDAYFTIDAGPQVKILCSMERRPRLAEEIGRLDGVQAVLLSRPGEGAARVRS